MRPDRLRIRHRGVRTTSDRGVREGQPDGRGGRTTARRTGVHRHMQAIPPMYIGRRGRYDGIADVDKSPLPQISVTSARGAPRVRARPLDRRPKPLLTWVYMDIGGFVAPSDNSSQFGNDATADPSVRAGPEALKGVFTPAEPGDPPCPTCSQQGGRARECSLDSSGEQIELCLHTPTKPPIAPKRESYSRQS